MLYISRKSCFFLGKTFPMKVLKRSKWSEILLPWYNPHLYWKKKPIRFIKPCKESIDNSLPGLTNATSKCYGSIIGMFRIVLATWMPNRMFSKYFSQILLSAWYSDCSLLVEDLCFKRLVLLIRNNLFGCK